MKIQDIVFFIIFVLLILKRKPKLIVVSGIVCLVLSIPLFTFWVFFTAERLTWYAAAFFFLAIIFHLFNSKKNMKTATLNIAILPSDEVVTQAIVMSKKIAKEVGSRFILNSDSLSPHITIYQAQYPSKNMDKVKNIARGLSLEQELFEIKLDAITVSHGTFLFWNCEKTTTLQNLHQRAVKLANPLREDLIPISLADVTGLSRGDKYDVKHFGALLIGPRYEPHITITRLTRKEDAEKAIRILGGSKNLSFKPKALILGYLGEHGTVAGVTESFRFKFK